MIISFSGLDGTGKTTQVELLCEYLENKGMRCSVRHAIKSSLSYFLNHKVIGKVSRSSSRGLEKSLRDDTKKITHAAASLVKKTFLLIDIMYFRLRYWLYKGNQKKTLICDRYFYDEVVQLEYLGLAGRVFTNVYNRMILAPDLAILFKLEADKAYNRKNEYDMKYFETKMFLYERLGMERNFSMIEPQNIEKMQEKIRTEIDKNLKQI